MNLIPYLLSFTLVFVLSQAASASETASSSAASSAQAPPAKTADLEIRSARVTYREDLDLLVFEQEVAGRAGATIPTAAGALHGAPVLGYVFPTNLNPADVGFGGVEGVVALAVTSHPDFDDTPLWDEDGDLNYANDGQVFHSHWVVLGPDDRVKGGLSVRQFTPGDESAILPPTNPGMPMFMDSPGFSIVLRGNALRVLVPAARVGGRTDFSFDAVTAFMRVDTSGQGPMLGVYEVYQVLSGDLSLPYRVTTADD